MVLGWCRRCEADVPLGPGRPQQAGQVPAAQSAAQGLEQDHSGARQVNLDLR